MSRLCGLSHLQQQATTISAVVQEMLLSKTSEGEGRLLDKDQSASVEKNKREGDF